MNTEVKVFCKLHTRVPIQETCGSDDVTGQRSNSHVDHHQAPRHSAVGGCRALPGPGSGTAGP